MACNCNAANYACSGTEISSNCVIWKGKPFPDLDICTGDVITGTIEIILTRLEELLEASSAPADVNLDTCLDMKIALAGRDKTIDNLLQILIDNQCTLKELIEQVEDSIPVPSNYAFQLKCVTPAGTVTDPNAIIQGIIDKLCALQTQVDTIAPNVETIVNQTVAAYLKNALKGLGNRGIKQQGTSPDLSFLFYSFVPPYCPIAYVGPLSNFDGDGKGLPGTAYEGWLLLNGRNGMFDVRGRTLVASVAGVPGPALDAAVNPALATNPATNYSTGDKWGESYQTLTVAQIPSHSHTVTDPGHNHSAEFPTSEKFSGSKFDAANATNIQYRPTTMSPTGISINAAGGGGAHNNRQPSFAITGYIMRID